MSKCGEKGYRDTYTPILPLFSLLPPSLPPSRPPSLPHLLAKAPPLAKVPHRLNA